MINQSIQSRPPLSGDIELGTMNNPQQVGGSFGGGAQETGTQPSGLTAGISSMARNFLAGGRGAVASMGTTDRATVTSTITKRIFAKKSLLAGAFVLFAAGNGTGIAIGKKLSRSGTQTIKPPVSPPKPSCPALPGSIHLAPKYVGSYDVNLLERAGFVYAKKALVQADQIFDQYAGEDGRLQIDVYSQNVWNEHVASNGLYVDFRGKTSISKSEFLREVLLYNVKDDTAAIGKQDRLVRMQVLWDNSDLSPDAVVDAQQWEKMVSISDWGRFEDVQESAALFQAEKFWGSLSEEIDEATWYAKGFKAAGYGDFSKIPGAVSGKISRPIFFGEVRSKGPFPETVSKQEVEYFAVNLSAAKAQMADLGLSQAGFNLIDAKTDGELFVRPFEDYATSVDGEFSFIDWGELVNAIDERFSTAEISPSRQLN